MSTLVEELIDAAEQYEHEAWRLRQEFSKYWAQGGSSLAKDADAFAARLYASARSCWCGSWMPSFTGTARSRGTLPRAPVDVLLTGPIPVATPCAGCLPAEGDYGDGPPPMVMGRHVEGCNGTAPTETPTK